ncbi:DUF2378 family protein [Corallococcus exiguus]|uniref:DUF2378 family protein n=1 Tax=Corallococcus exiguus TaxID=83462 RepID=A0A7X4YBZ4_9BACT|nr:DUF2378 family protein [Corallococcus exiguus]NBC41884.1 DUF2378 family protein [Corallococcus exiguus]TNV61606.1 DUF2378 family protein [Corallococcus exiguus]
MQAQAKPYPEAGAVEADWAVRRMAATELDTARGMFFLGVLETVRTDVGEEAVAACRAVTDERRFVGFFNYPVASFLKLAQVAARQLSPRWGGFDEALRQMGMQATRSFLESAVGRTFLLLAAGDPRKLVTNLPSGYQMAVSYGERTVDWKGEGDALFVMRRDFMPPAYHEGVLREVLTMVGARNPRVHGRKLGLLDTEYHITWEVPVALPTEPPRPSRWRVFQ